ncbi:MAG: hypothetical protein Q7T05_03005, partial [Dehalococcoidia bacterium]|nr:hypothetical protein [Dehalococcoidia bacterium]
FDKLEFRLQRRAGSYTAVYGSLGGHVGELVQEAFALIRAHSPEAFEKTEGAIAALKQKFV